MEKSIRTEELKTEKKLKETEEDYEEDDLCDAYFNLAKVHLQIKKLNEYIESGFELEKLNTY